MKKYLLIVLLVGVWSCEDEQKKDCSGVPGGTAVLDNCDQCVGGETGLTACIEDCNGQWGGASITDCAGVCDGNNLDQDNDGICDWNDGDSYPTIIIGEQEWMLENLKVTHYKNGDSIPRAYIESEWSDLSTGAYTVYNDNENNLDTYGNLYNWYAVDDDRGICPIGWRVPTDEEFTLLINYLGGENVAGGKLKECTQGSCPNSDYWTVPNDGATNESGFTGLPGGKRMGNPGNSTFQFLRENAYFWSSTDANNYTAFYLQLYVMRSDIDIALISKEYGFSVRCIKD